MLSQKVSDWIGFKICSESKVFSILEKSISFVK